jgi:hypothetical protein
MKKSRFFGAAAGRSDTTLPPMKKKPRIDEGQTDPQQPSGSGTSTAENDVPLLVSVAQVNSGRAPPDSEAETELEEASSEDERHTGEPDGSDQENFKPSARPQLQPPAQDEANIRRNRRAGIYGVESLLPAGVDPNSAQGATLLNPVLGTERRPGATFHQYPPGYAHNLMANMPPGNTYTFGGVPTNPYVQPPGGQYPFHFRPAPGMPVPTAFQQGATNLYQHPMGSGLARMAHNSGNAGNGPFHPHPAQPAHPFQPSPRVTQPFTLNTLRSSYYVDMDRDARGRLLQAYDPRPRPIAHHGVYPPPHLKNPESLVPEHIYTSPMRVERAHHFVRSLKRKRPEMILPPMSYIYQHTGSPNFNIFNGFLLYPELCYALATQLPVKDLISLYAISKDFHTILDTRFTTVILSQAMHKAAESAKIFNFRSYKALCRNDPAVRIPHPNTIQAEAGVVRKIPSFRWLQMVLHREKVVQEIMAVFAEDGIPLPPRCAFAIKKLWFLLDIPDNARRIGFTHSRQTLTDLDLFFASCFFTRLDMRVNDPIVGEKRDGTRKFLLAQRSFTTILRILKREEGLTRFEILKEWVRLKYEPQPDEVGLSIFDVPAEQVGRGKLEFWGLKTEKEVGRKIKTLLRPDQLVIREVFRRGMRFDKHYLRFLLYGYVRYDNFDNYAPREISRRVEAMQDDEYEVDDIVGGVTALGVDDIGFDDLLDLGRPRNPSKFTFVKEQMSRGEEAIRQRDDDLLDKCIEWWERENGDLVMSG